MVSARTTGHARMGFAGALLQAIAEREPV